MKKISLTLTAADIPNSLRADCSIVIDVLRASSVIVTALAHQTPFILAASSVEEAWQIKADYPDAELAGERNAIKIDGFARGNSPREYLNSASQNPLILTTTNGTLALSKVRKSSQVLIACFLNIDAISEYLLQSKFDNIHLASAGTNGQFSLDDFLMAGGLVDRICYPDYQIDDLSLAAKYLYQKSRNNIQSTLEPSKHYQTLLSKGFQKDLDFCLRENIYPIVPEMVPSLHVKIVIRQIK